jgi:hypothetical protein
MLSQFGMGASLNSMALYDRSVKLGCIGVPISSTVDVSEQQAMSLSLDSELNKQTEGMEA